MTSYVAIADSEIDPESPGTTTLFTKLRDNPIAITEKASGAPVLANGYVVTAMIADANVTTPKIADADVTTAKLESGERMNTTNVLGATAGAAAGAVGTYAFLGEATSVSSVAGSTLSGASLRYSGFSTSSSWNNSTPTTLEPVGGTTAPAGTWRCMGRTGTTYGATLWLRIS